MHRSVPWPPSILPKNTVTLPSRAIAIHESSSVGSSVELPPLPAITCCASTSPGAPAEKANTNAPALPISSRREISICVVAFMVSSSRHLLGRALHRAHNRGMRAATAFDPGQRLPDFRIRRPLFAFQERRRRHDPAVQAIAALRHLFL